MAWYNKYRPTSFDEVIGQELVKSVLQNSLKKNKIKHAYLLSGPKGVGKTTLARIFANELNQTSTNTEASIDIIEMDAASNTGIDDVRQLINSAKTPPITGQHKIYIIDEVHMLSKQAMNALLKILEEPPSYIVFLLATTNPEKILPTVLSRLTKLNLSSHTLQDITQKLSTIAQAENIDIDKKSLDLIAKRAGGSQRDAINLLETIGSYELDKYDIQNTSQLLGLLPTQILDDLIQAITSSSINKDILKEVEQSGIDPNSLLSQLLEHLLDDSFETSNTNTSLIQSIAKVISQRLPVSSTTSAIALIVSNLDNHTSTTPKTTTPKPSYSGPTTKNIETSPTVKTSTKKTASKSDTNTQKPTSNSSRSIKDLQSYLEELKNSCPPMIKMILTDLFVDSIEGEQYNLCVTNGIIESQIKAEKNFKWLQEQLNSFAGSEVSINIKIQKNNQPITQQAPSQDQEHEDFTVEEVAEPIDEVTEPVTQSSPEPKPVDSSKIFYKIFKNKPQEIQESAIPVYAEDIPSPQIEQESVEDMFELE